MKRLVFAIGLCSLAWAQDFRANIMGQVLDASGLPIPNATVTATKEDTNVSRQTLTNTEGVYTLVGLDPGRYTVTIAAAGFNTGGSGAARHSVQRQVCSHEGCSRPRDPAPGATGQLCFWRQLSFARSAAEPVVRVSGALAGVADRRGVQPVQQSEPHELQRRSHERCLWPAHQPGHPGLRIGRAARVSTRVEGELLMGALLHAGTDPCSLSSGRCSSSAIDFARSHPFSGFLPTSVAQK